MTRRCSVAGLVPIGGITGAESLLLCMLELLLLDRILFGAIPNHGPPTVALMQSSTPPQLHTTGSCCHVRALALCKAHACKTWCLSPPPAAQARHVVSRSLQQHHYLTYPYSQPIRLPPSGIAFLNLELQTLFVSALIVPNLSRGQASSGLTRPLLGWHRLRWTRSSSEG